MAHASKAATRGTPVAERPAAETVVPDADAVAAGTTEVATGTRISWPHLCLAGIGFALPLYSLRLHNVIAAGGESGCSFTETITCDKVLTSDYAKFFSIPLGAYGMAFFVLVALTAITTNPRTSQRQAAGWRLLVTTAGLASSIAMMYISLAIIKAACPVCMATHTTNLLLFLVSLYGYFKVSRSAPHL